MRQLAIAFVLWCALPASAADVAVPLVFVSLPEGGSEPPDVALIDADGRRHTPHVRLNKRDVRLGTTQLLFCNVGPSPLTATLSGARWKDVELPIEEGAAPQPLRAEATTKLTVHWWTLSDPIALAAQLRTCETDQRPPTPPTATLMRCADHVRGRDERFIAKNDCQEVASQPLDTSLLRGTVTFEDVAAGLYFVRFTLPKLPQLWRSVEASASESSVADAELRWFQFFGRVTRGGEPVAVRLFNTVSDAEDGRYVAVVERQPEIEPETLASCDRKLRYDYVPESRPVENAAFDIDIPVNRLLLDVVDAATRKPIPRAFLNFGALSDSKTRQAHFSHRIPLREDGYFEIAPVVPTQPIHVCASADEYENQCVEPFTMGEMKEKQVTLALEKLVTRRGRIIGGGSGKIERGRLIWYGPEGTMREMVVRFEEDGSFTYKRPHAEGEIVVLVAANRPLYAFLQPALTPEQTFEIRIPAAPVRTFQVSLAQDFAEEVAFLALRIGDVVVPMSALSFHGQARGLDFTLSPGMTRSVPQVLETGPIRVVLIPLSMLQRYGGSPIELPLVPEAASLPQQELGARAAVTFQ
jgi:hypothetical protein